MRSDEAPERVMAERSLCRACSTSFGGRRKAGLRWGHQTAVLQLEPLLDDELRMFVRARITHEAPPSLSKEEAPYGLGSLNYSAAVGFPALRFGSESIVSKMQEIN